MAKVDFKLNDTLVRRQRAEQSLPDTPPSSTPASGPAGVVAVEPPPADQRPLVLPEPRHEHEPSGPRRPAAVQTSVLLPPSLWDHLARLTSESGGLATPNRLLIDVLQARGPHDLQQAAEDLDQFLSLPIEQSRVGDPWEERNVRLPIELRKRLDELRRKLTAAGLSQATRAHLIAASLLLRGPSTGEQARALMAELRTEAFRRAIAAEDLPTPA
jgi:hypothetical protein